MDVYYTRVTPKYESRFRQSPIVDICTLFNLKYDGLYRQRQTVSLKSTVVDVIGNVVARKVEIK